MHAPAWLTTRRSVDRTLGVLKTGKEAEILLIERCAIVDDDDGAADAERVLLAHKRYRPMVVAKGDLEAGGFAKARTFTADAAYRAGTTFRSGRDARAAAGKSKHGRRVLAERWVAREAESLERAHALGVRVPYLVEAHDDGIVMQFVGDDDGAAAPRLVDAHLDRAAATLAYEQLREELVLLVGGGLVHADLSPYNALWWRDEVWLIDLPQAVDIAVNPNAFDLLHHDVLTMATWLVRRGVDVDGEQWFADLLTVAFGSS